MQVTILLCPDFLFILFFFPRGSVFDKIEEEEEEEEGEEDADGESFKTDIEVDDRTYSVGNESSLNEGLRSRVREPLKKSIKHLQVDYAACEVKDISHHMITHSIQV